jgi:hypothetical protein
MLAKISAFINTMEQVKRFSRSRKWQNKMVACSEQRAMAGGQRVANGLRRATTCNRQATRSARRAGSKGKVTHDIGQRVVLTTACSGGWQ